MDSPDPQGNQVAVEYSSAVVQALQAVDPAHSLVELVGSPDLLDSQEAAEYLQSLDPAELVDSPDPQGNQVVVEYSSAVDQALQAVDLAHSLVAQEGSPGLQDSQEAEDD